MLVFLALLGAASAYDVVQVLTMDDILKPDLMPTKLIMLDASTGNLTNAKLPEPVSNGSWNAAFDTMKFHRKMFNEYLCRSFVASKILNHIHRPRISNRMGKPSESDSKRKSRADSLDIKENLLFDPGSSNYKNWLSKTTTLDDIRQHYVKDSPISRVGDDSVDEYEGGEITGYAVPGPIDTKDYPQPYPGFVPSMGPMRQDSEKHGGGYDYTPHHIHFHGGESEGDEKTSHEIELPHIFEVALTALAFLSFGLFILQVIMCISSSKTTTFLPMPMASADPEAINEIRFKRDLPMRHSATNELARRVLESIEVAGRANDDDGVCLRRTLCRDNKRSRTMKLEQKVLVPIWGLGMSWLSGRLIKGIPPATTIMESLKACIFGLANADCDSLYSKCITNNSSK